MNACTYHCGFCGRCESASEPGDNPRYPVTCDWCERLIWDGKELLAHGGGRFCDDECATNYGIGLADGSMPVIEIEPPPPTCDECGSILLGGENGEGTYIQGVGRFCHKSRKPQCSAAGVEKHRRAMEPRVLQGRW